MISAVVIAVGRAEWPTPPSFLQPLAGKPVLQWVLENAVHSELHEVICVVSDLAAVRPQISLVDEKLFWLVDYGADRGASHSMIAGLWSIHPQSSGALFLPSRQPPVRKELIDALVKSFEKSSARIFAPSFLGKPGAPLLFRRDLFPELLKLGGGQDGFDLIEKYPAETTLIEWHDDGPAPDRAPHHQSTI